MDITQKLDLLKGLLFNTFKPRIDSNAISISSLQQQISEQNVKITMLQQMIMARPSGGGQQSEEANQDFGDQVALSSQVLRYRAIGTTITKLSADDPMSGQGDHVVIDQEKKRGPYKTREEALAFATTAFGPQENYNFYITQDRGL